MIIQLLKIRLNTLRNVDNVRIRCGTVWSKFVRNACMNVLSILTLEQLRNRFQKVNDRDGHVCSINHQIK